MRLCVAVGLVCATFVSGSSAQEDDPVAMLVARLDLERYKGTIKALTQFGDRRQGTPRNQAANNWIQAQLEHYGCANVERMPYRYAPEPFVDPPLGMAGGTPRAIGGGRPRGTRVPLRANTDPLRQPDVALRALNSEPTEPGLRDQVYCTKVGATRPDEMYIVSAHMDGQGWGDAANDNASGVALVLELARLFNGPDVRTERSIRFVLWNNEETDYGGSRAYIAQRRVLQGKEDPPGSGRYPEPTWLGLIQHDMLLFDHGMPRPTAPSMSNSVRRPTSTSSSSARPHSRSSHTRWRGPSRRPMRSMRRTTPSQWGITWRVPIRKCSWTLCRRSVCATTSAACRSAPDGIRTGIKPVMCTRRTATRTSGSASTPRRRRSVRLVVWWAPQF